MKDEVTARKAASKTAVAGQRRIQPLYHQIYVQLRHLLTETALDVSEPLPSEPTLAQRYGVSRVTIRKTLDQLQLEGLIRRVHGKGTFPARTSHALEKTNISSVLDNLLSFEKRTSAVNLEWGMVDAGETMARQLDSERCLRIIRLRSMEGVPISYTTLHVAEKYAGLLDRQAIGDEPIVRALDRLGVQADHADQVITAISATDDIGAYLKVESGTPLIVMRRLMFDVGHAPVLHQESRYPPDRFEYRMTLSRSSIGPVAQWSPTS